MSSTKLQLSTRYGVAILATLVALLIRSLLHPWLGTSAPLLVFVLAVMVSGWYGGLGPGLFATGLSGLVGGYFFLPPLLSVAVAEMDDLVRVGIFVTEGVLISWLNERLRASKQRAETIASSLHESEERYRLLVEGVKDYAIFSLDLAGHVTSWNKGAELIKGYGAAEILGRHFSIFYTAADLDQGKPEHGLQVAVAEGRYESRGWRRRKDGSLFWADVVITALKDQNGNLKGFSKISRDITEQQQLLESLQASEARFRRLFESNLIGIVFGHVQGTITEANDAFLQIIGYTQADLQSSGLNWWQMTPPEFKVQTQESLEQLRQEGASPPFEKEYIRKDGSRVQVLIGWALLNQGAEEVVGFVLDISARYQAERALEASYNLLQTVIEGTTDAVFVKDRQGRYQLLNATTAQIIGKTRAEILGKNDAELLPPEVAAVLQATDLRVMATGRGETIEEQIHIDRLRTYLSTKDPYRDTEGKVIGVIGVARDITERKQAEAVLLRSYRRLEALQEIDRSILRADSAAEIAQVALSRLTGILPCHQAAVILFDFATSEGQILAGQIAEAVTGAVIPIADWIPIDLLKYRESTWYIQDISTLVQRPPVLEQQLASGYRSFLAVALVAEATLIGDLILYAKQPAAFDQKDLEIAGEVANQLAISIQQARLREQLQQYATELEQRVTDRTVALQEANEGLEAFAYSVSHDLRAPLRAMQGLAQALLEDYGDQFDSLGQTYAERIVVSAQRMDTLIQDLLNYSRLSRVSLNIQPINLTSVVAEVLAQAEPELQKQQAQVLVENPLPNVQGHRATLAQVLINLVMNAVKFVPAERQPRIRIWTTQCNEWVRLWIEDNGIGIAPEHQDRIFQAFERLHSADTYPGTGIGLAIVRKGVERMGGRVGLVSQLGSGSQFWVELQGSAKS